VWNTNEGDGQGSMEIRSVDIDSSNNLYMTGQFFWPTTMSPFTLNTLDFFNSLFVAKINSVTYQADWVLTSKAFCVNEGYSLIVDDANNDLYLGGTFGCEMTFATQPNTITQSDITLHPSQFTLFDGFIMKMKTTGEVVWAKTLDYAIPNSITLSPTKNYLYAAGQNQYLTFFGTAQLVTYGAPYVTTPFIAKFLASTGVSMGGFNNPNSAPGIDGIQSVGIHVVGDGTEGADILTWTGRYKQSLNFFWLWF